MSSEFRVMTAGSTSKSILIKLVQDAAATSPGEAITGLAYNTASLTAYYKINGTGTATAITLATQTATGAWSSGGFVECDATNMPGLYRLDVPNAAIATAGEVAITLQGAADLAAHTVTVQLTAVDFYDSVRAGMTALPNAAADAAGGLPISDAGGLDLDTLLGYLTAAVATAAELAKVPKSDSTVTWNSTALASINAEVDTALSDYDAPTNTEMVAAFTEIKGATWATTDTLEAIRDRGDAAWVTGGGGTGGLITSGTAAAIADGTITLAGSHGVTNTTVLVVLDGGTNAVGKSRIATYSGTGDVFNVDPAWNATVNGVTETTPSGTITYEVYPIPPAGTTNLTPVEVASMTAAGIAKLFNTDSGTTYASAVAGSAVKEIADNAGGSSLTLADIADAVWDEATSGHATAGTTGKALSDILADTNELQADDYPTTLATLATAANLATVDTVVDAIKVVTDALPDAGALTSIATAANLATVDTVVDAIKAKTDSLTFTVAGQVDANAKSMNDAEILGDGTSGDLWRGE